MDVPEQGIYVKFHHVDGTTTAGEPIGSTGAANEVYEYGWMYNTPTNERRHWWQLWRERQHLLWSGRVHID